MNELHSFFKWAALIVIATIIYDTRFEHYHFFKNGTEIIRCHKVTGICEHSNRDSWFPLVQDPVDRFHDEEIIEYRIERAEKLIKEKLAEKSKSRIQSSKNKSSEPFDFISAAGIK